MPTPSSVQIATTNNWLGSLAAFNLLKPEIDPNQYKTFGDEDITGLIDMMGSKSSVKNIEYRHFEDSRLHTIVRATGSTGGANTNVVYTVDAAFTMTSFPDVFDPYNAASFGSQAPNPSGTTTLHPVRANQGILFPDGTRGTVLSVTTTTFTVMPDLAGGSLPTVLNTENIVLMAVIQGEGADSPLGVNNREDVYQNVLEIIGESSKTTGTALGEQTWVKFDGKDGKTGYLWWYKQQDTTLRNFKNLVEMDIVAGEKITNTVNIAAVDATLLKTEGLYTFAASFNGDTNYSIASGLSLDDFDSLIIDNIDKNEGAMENAIMASINLRKSINGFIRPEMQAGGVVYNTFSGGSEQSVNFGYSSFEDLGYTFHLKTYKMLNNPTYLGGNTAFNNSGLVLPLDKYAYSMGEDRRKETVGSFQMRYMDQAGMSRETEEYMRGGTAGFTETANDSVDYILRAQVGFEGYGAPRFNTLFGT